jgi:hypothetical protein
MNTGIVPIIQKWDDNNPPSWLSKIDFEVLQKLAAVGYTPENIAMYFDVQKIEFMYYFMLEDSRLKYYYDRGILFYQAQDGIKMISDTSQATRLDKLRDNINFRNAVDEIVYGGI